MPARSTFVEVGVWFLAGAVPVAVLAAGAAAVGRAEMPLPPLLLAPLFAGLGLMGLLAVVLDRPWFDRTPVAQQWYGLLGRGVGRACLTVLFTLFVAAAVTVAAYPLWGPAPLAAVPDQPDPVPAPAEPATGSPEYITAAVHKLRSADPKAVEEALHQLQDARDITARPDTLRAELLRLLEQARTTGRPNPADVLDAVERWGALADVPKLEAVPDPDRGLADRLRRAVVVIRKRELGPGRYALAEFRTGDPARMKEAASHLKGVRDDEITDRPPELSVELLKLVRTNGADGFARSYAASALGRFASAADLPALEAAHAELTAARMGDLADDLKSSIDRVKFAAGK